MCRNGAASFDLCDQKKEVEDCKGMLRCGTFSFIPKVNASRLYAKSCTTIALCSGNNSFCKGIGEQCRVQCCDSELCNFQKGFATSPPLPTTVTLAPTTEPSSTPLPPPETTKPSSTPLPPPETTKPTPTEPISTPKPVDPSKEPQSGMDEEDCSWVYVDAASSLKNNICIIGMCLFVATIFS
jgi:hypothetical protein